MHANQVREHWLYRAIFSRLPPPQAMDCLTWNRTHGRLSMRDSSRPGAWSDTLTPYCAHWLDLASARKLGRRFMGDRDPFAHLTEQMWIVKGSQTGLTRSILLAILGWLVDQQPGPCGYFLPRKGDFSETQAERLLPFFEETPALNKHLPPKGTEHRKLRITKDSWHLDTCTIHYLCSSIAAELRSKPLCDEAWDEFDENPIDVEGQGDAIDLGLGRQKTFGRRRLAFGVTTPTDLFSPGWRRLLSGSHERLLVDCLECGATQELSWDGLRVQVSETEILALTGAIKAGVDHERVMVSGASERAGAGKSLARWACAYCGRTHTDAERDRIVGAACRAGRWVPGQWVQDETRPNGLWTPWAEFDAGHRLTSKATCETVIRTGHLHSLYSTFMTLAECAAGEMKLHVSGSDEAWVTHRNNNRAEPTLPITAQDAPTIESLGEIHPPKQPRYTAPVEALKVLITCDQQGNERERCWFPYVVRAWGPEGESWLVDAGAVYGWDELALLEEKAWTIGTARRTCDQIALDAANGNVRPYTQQWAQAKANRRLLLHGRDRLKSPVVQRFARDPRKQAAPGKKLLPGIRYYYTDVDAWKTLLDDRIRGAPGLPGWHLCTDLPDAYYASLGSEHRTRVRSRSGRNSTRYVPRTIVTPTGREEEREDTHWWDCEHMQLAAAHVLKFDQLKAPDPEPTTAPPPASGGWFAGFDA